MVFTRADFVDVLFLCDMEIDARLKTPFFDAKLSHLLLRTMQMGIERDRCSLRMGISHCWSDAGGSNFVFPTVGLPPCLRSDERICSLYGPGACCSKRISYSVGCF